jgi:hypothetical protein
LKLLSSFKLKQFRWKKLNWFLICSYNLNCYLTKFKLIAIYEEYFNGILLASNTNNQTLSSMSTFNNNSNLILDHTKSNSLNNSSISNASTLSTNGSYAGIPASSSNTNNNNTNATNNKSTKNTTGQKAQISALQNAMSNNQSKFSCLINLSFFVNKKEIGLELCFNAS